MFFNNKKFAVIGTGFIFRTHLQAINKIGGQLVDAVNESHGKEAWKEMVENTKASYIVILTPNDLHFSMAKFSAEKEKVVLCEKPLTINSEEVKILMNYPNIFTVCQLRYHPLTQKLKSEILRNKYYHIEMEILVYRDENYWKSWKGQKERSGGILFNLGIHYFDLLLYLFGDPIRIFTKYVNDKIGEGEIEGKNYLCRWRIDATAEKGNQKRIFTINGKSYNFSSKENLAQENLHYLVYKDLIRGKGITPREAFPSICLIEKLYENYKK